MGTPRKKPAKRVRNTKNGRKSQTPASPAKPVSKIQPFTAAELAALPQLLKDFSAQAKLQIAALKLEAIAARESGKRILTIACRELLPEAKKLAARGKPRTLAIVSRILLSKQLQF
jgi:hypothetical protein